MRRVITVGSIILAAGVMFAATGFAADQTISGSKSCTSNRYVSVTSITAGPIADTYTYHYYAGVALFSWGNTGHSVQRDSTGPYSSTTWKVQAPTVSSASASCSV